MGQSSSVDTPLVMDSIEVEMRSVLLLGLPVDMRRLILAKLSARALARVRRVCFALRDEASDDALWTRHAARTLADPEFHGAISGARELVAELHTGDCALCDRRLERSRAAPDGGVRPYACECLAPRRAVLTALGAWPELNRSTITICSLSVDRVGESGGVDWPPLAAPLLSTLAPFFEVTLRALHTLESVRVLRARLARQFARQCTRPATSLAEVFVPRRAQSSRVPPAPVVMRHASRRHASLSHCRARHALEQALLDGVDLLVLNTTSATVPLSAAEADALASWVRAGGTAVLNSFSNWAASAQGNAPLVGWLGAHARMGAAFGARAVVPLSTEPEIVARARALLRGPFGAVRAWGNVGDTAYGLDAAVLGAEPSEFRLADRLHWFEGAPAVGAGRVLLCSNFHWLVDGSGWTGGYLDGGAREGSCDNAALLRNLAAIACAPPLDGYEDDV
jgi:hypothetical protein